MRSILRRPPLLAAWIAGRRVGRVDPLEALKND